MMKLGEYTCTQRSICRGKGWGFNPHWLKMTPILVTENFCLGSEGGKGRTGEKGGKGKGKGREGRGRTPTAFLDKSNPGCTVQKSRPTTRLRI